MRAISSVILALIFTGCEPGCVSSAQAREWTKFAQGAEAAGDVYDAWYAYKSIGIANACGFDPQQRQIANEQRQRLFEEINLAYDATEKAIYAFRSANGRLPTSLSEIANDIPDSARRAFAGFRYEIRGDHWTFILEQRAA